ncbi:hypothetical protein Hamer_G002695, partial [Homarus americanus]
MRVLCLNVCAILVAYAVVQAYGDSTIDLNPVIISPFLSNSNNTLLVMDLMKKHFDDSLKYLYTGELTLDNTEVIADKYVNTLKDIVIDSISRSHKMNKMHHVASKWRHGDPE